MNRRGFMAGILAGTAAPSIVKAESLMRLWVPRQAIFHRGGIVSPLLYVPGEDHLHCQLNLSADDAYARTEYAYLKAVAASIGIPYQAIADSLSAMDYSPSLCDLADRAESLQPGRTL